MKHTVSIVTFWASGLLFLVEATAQPCGQVKVGYPDQERAPFIMGTGAEVPNQPGAAVELIRATLEARHCTVTLVRLPEARLVPALASGRIDFVPIAVDDKTTYPFAIPTRSDGTYDPNRTLALDIVVYVRAEDRIPGNIPAIEYFANRILGANLGASPVAALRKRGLRVDDGALDLWRNLEKLRLRRVDGVVIVSTNNNHLDARINRELKGAIVKLRQPIMSLHFTLGASASFYKDHPLLVSAVWDDIGKHWQRQFQERVRQYQRAD